MKQNVVWWNQPQKIKGADNRKSIARLIERFFGANSLIQQKGVVDEVRPS